jgi:hypothetical protein
METTLRDEIAIQFMSSILTSVRINDYLDEPNIMEAISKDAYLMADKMIEIRNKTN